MSGKHASGADLHALFKEAVRLYSALDEVMDAIHEEAGMRTPQIKMATVLVELGQATVPDVAHAMKVSRQFVQTEANRLEKAGLLIFLDNPRHKRSRLMEMTDRGRKVVYETHARENALIGRLLPDLEGPGIRNASKVLQGVRKRVETMKESSFFPMDD